MARSSTAGDHVVLVLTVREAEELLDRIAGPTLLERARASAAVNRVERALRAGWLATLSSMADRIAAGSRSLPADPETREEDPMADEETTRTEDTSVETHVEETTGAPEAPDDGEQPSTEDEPVKGDE